MDVKRTILCLLACLLLHADARLQIHDASFIPDYVLNVTYGDAAMGCKLRTSLMINGAIPGPLISIKEGSTSWIRVYNDIPDQNLTIHWHGLSQSVAPFSDGTPRASQWPIPPMHFFDYEVAPEAGVAGTYFYHSHIDFQASTAAGPLIVTEADGPPPYTYDEERIMFISELYNKTDEMITSGLTQDLADFWWSGEAEALLVNGNAANSTDAVSSSACGSSVAYGPPCNDTYFSEHNQVTPCSPEVITVQPGKTYRFRSIGAMAISPVSFAFEGHDSLTIIQADGLYTQPLIVDHVQLGTGQRYDFLLQTKTLDQLQADNKTSYLIQIQSRNRPTNITNYAILLYEDPSNTANTNDFSALAQPSIAPLVLPGAIWNWNAETELLPLQPNTSDFPSAAEVTRRVYLHNQQMTRTQGLFWTINANTWRENSSLTINETYDPSTDAPYLVSIYAQGEAAIPSMTRALANGGRDPVFNAYPVELGEVLEVIILNYGDQLPGGLDSHTWHIHGRHVYDLGAGSGNYNASTADAALQERYAASSGVPPLRDTTFLYKYTDGDDLNTPAGTVIGWRAWRMLVNNPGVWMVHCHLLQHMIMGMQTVWVVGNASQITAKNLTESQGYLTYGGEVYGNATYAPNVNHYFES